MYLGYLVRMNPASRKELSEVTPNSPAQLSQRNTMHSPLTPTIIPAPDGYRFTSITSHGYSTFASAAVPEPQTALLLLGAIPLLLRTRREHRNTPSSTTVVASCAMRNQPAAIERRR